MAAILQPAASELGRYGALSTDEHRKIMSQKIDDVLDVLRRIRQGCHPGIPRSVKESRINAIHDIAKERGVSYQTIGDAYLRRLKPDIGGTPQFDKVVCEWLNGESSSLRNILKKHSRDPGDDLEIRNFFLEHS